MLLLGKGFNDGEKEKVGILGNCPCITWRDNDLALEEELPGVGDMEESVGDGECMHKFWSISRPLGVNGLLEVEEDDASGPLLLAPPSSPCSSS